MINKNIERSLRRGPIIIENSPVPFVISGPGGKHRESLVRSTHDNLDLVSFDRPLRDQERRYYSPFSVASSLLLLNPQLPNTNSVRSDAIASLSQQHEYGSGDDPRASYLTFSWRGNATQRTVEYISGLFEIASVDIYEAIQERSSAQLEWHLSPIIHACVYGAAELDTRRKTLGRIGIVVVGAYFVVAAATVAAVVVERLKVPVDIRVQSKSE